MKQNFLSLSLVFNMVLLPLGSDLEGSPFYGKTVDDFIEVGGYQQSPPSGDKPKIDWSVSLYDPNADFELSSYPRPSYSANPEDSFCGPEVVSRECIPDAIRRGEIDADEEPGPTPEEMIGAISAQIERDVTRLPVVPARPRYQPEGGEVLVNMETIFYTDAEPQFLYTSLLGFPVTIEVVPSWFEWTFGDGSATLGTDDRGAPYPNHTVSHVYESAGDNIVTLRTTWNARFRVEGLSGWIPVRGQPVTEDQVGPIEAVSKTSKLVHIKTG